MHTLPIELKSLIFKFISDEIPTWRTLSREVAGIGTYIPLAESYTNNETLQPLVKKVGTNNIIGPIPPNKLVQEVYKTVIGNARQFSQADRILKATLTDSFSAAPISSVESTHLQSSSSCSILAERQEQLKALASKQTSPSSSNATLSPWRLEKIVQWTQEQQKARDTLKVFKKIAERCAAADAVLRTLNPNNLTDCETKICTWMNGNRAELERIFILRLDNLHLQYLPAILGNLTQLQSLYSSNNQLTRLPPEIGRLTQLQSLHLSNNRLIELPPAIGRLTQLQGLYLSNNQLTWLPPEIGRLTQLEWFDLSNNQLTQLPPEMRHLTQLQRPVR